MQMRERAASTGVAEPIPADGRDSALAAGMAAMERRGSVDTLERVR